MLRYIDENITFTIVIIIIIIIIYIIFLLLLLLFYNQIIIYMNEYIHMNIYECSVASMS